jgi:hypothetical protein
MMLILMILSVVVALAWLPLLLRFFRGWRNRRNPVSLAICAALCLFTYTNVLFLLVLLDSTSWRFFAWATHVFEVIVLVNFYVAFKWSSIKFPDARHLHHSRAASPSLPPLNVTDATSRP